LIEYEKRKLSLEIKKDKTQEDQTMTKKVYMKPAKTIFVAQLVIIPLFMIFGIVLLSLADREVMPYVAIFILIWEAGCIALLINAVKALKRMRNGKIEVAEIDDIAGGEEGSFATKLRELAALKKDGLITEEEYQNKRALIMQDKH
jgi:putative oligomerization/nucleic acid binding protein